MSHTWKAFGVYLQQVASSSSRCPVELLWWMEEFLESCPSSLLMQFKLSLAALNTRNSKRLLFFLTCLWILNSVFSQIFQFLIEKLEMKIQTILRNLFFLTILNKNGSRKLDLFTKKLFFWPRTFFQKLKMFTESQNLLDVVCSGNFFFFFQFSISVFHGKTLKISLDIFLLIGKNFPWKIISIFQPALILKCNRLDCVR